MKCQAVSGRNIYSKQKIFLTRMELGSSKFLK